MSTSFTEHFDQHGAWRRAFALRLKLLSEWLRDHELLDAAVEERLRRLEHQIRSDRVMVAFVAEFSRGKSELINAIFFAEYGRRIMPASAGRTTMCPTELGYDAAVAPCLRLLPVETRLDSMSLADWRMAPEKWTRINLDVDDPEQLSQAMEKVAEVRRVTRDEARALGFWDDDIPENNPPVDGRGMVEVPRWRHALINIPHPLLKQGLIILDTPGLNAIGAEPELTVSLIPQAHAVVFILAADTGVTRSDLAIWREHLITESDSSDTRVVVLNKIDTLWDGLSTPEQVQAQIDRQCRTSAEILGVEEDQVIPVSAQKGLLAKVTDDAALLQASCLQNLEVKLGLDMLGRRQQILRSAVAGSIADLQAEAIRIINIRRRDFSEQKMELKGLSGKNASVIRHMHSRIEIEQQEFNTSGAKIQAIRSVHLKLLRDVFDLLGSKALKAELGGLSQLLRQPGLKLGVRKAYADTFAKLHENLEKASRLSGEIQTMLQGAFRQLNTEHGFSLQAPRVPDMKRYRKDLKLVERSHSQYLGIGNTLKLAQPEFADRLVRALSTRLRVVYESALGEVELWNKSAAAQLDVQLRERRRSFGRRIEAIERIQNAASGLAERISEIEMQEIALKNIDEKLLDLTHPLLAAALESPQEQTTALQTA